MNRSNLYDMKYEGKSLIFC